MADKIKVRDVGLREIYDSYMGILRISPNEEMEDDITEQLLDGTEIQLSDSDGNALSLTFVGKSKETVIKLNKDTSKLVNFISIVSKVKDVLFACKSANIRSTLYLGRKKEDNTNSNLLVVSQEYKSDAGRKDILLYPIDSPYNKLYWNDKSRPVDERIELEYSDDNDAILEEKLLEHDPDWYNNPYKIKDYVKVNGKPVYVTNNNDELIPVLYNKCCVLGNRVNATGKLTDFLRGEYVQSTYYRYDHLYTYPDIRSESILSSQSFITRLSYFDVDKIIWEGIDEVAKGKIRHTSAGRYEELGANADTNLKNDLFHIKRNDDTDFSIALDPRTGMRALRAYSLVDTAPLLGTSVTPGIIMYNAMPMKKFAYNALRQIKANYEKNYITTQQFKNNPNVINIQTFSNKGIDLTRATTGEKTSAIKLVKNFVLCNGATIAGTEYGNHPHLDSKNERLAQIMPVNGKGDDYTIYSLITKTINLLDFNTTSNRYLRGQMWYFVNEDEFTKKGDDDESEPVTCIKSGEGGLQPGDYGNVKQGDNEHKIEVIRMDTADNPYSTRKNFGTSMMPYMVNYDSRIQRKSHRHYMFSSKEGTSPAEQYTYTGNIPVMRRGIFGSRFKTRYGTSKAKNVISGQAVCRHNVENWTGWMRGDRDINYYEPIPWYVFAKNLPSDDSRNLKDATLSKLNGLGLKYSPYNNREKDFEDLTIRINNEREAMKPISRWGGSTGMRHENGYTVRRGHNHKGEKHKTKYLYSYDIVGGYQIGGVIHEIGDVWANDENSSKRYIEVGLSSGPYNDRKNLGNENGNTLIKDKAGEELGDETEFRKIVSIGGSDNIKLYNNTPNPASISLLPLLRI